jgi:hypothetical protein
MKEANDLRESDDDMTQFNGGINGNTNINDAMQQQYTSSHDYSTMLQVRYANGSSMRPVPPAWQGVPIHFVDATTQASIACYADSTVLVNGNEYTIGIPCDYTVALCRLEENENEENDESDNESDDEEESDKEDDGDDVDGVLVMLEIDDPLLDDVFPAAAEVVAAQFGEDLVLQRTPQTLTLVGELEEEEEENDDDTVPEEIQFLLSFVYEDQEYSLVRMRNPDFLVGKADSSNRDRRILLTPEESETIIPVIEALLIDCGYYE